MMEVMHVYKYTKHQWSERFEIHHATNPTSDQHQAPHTYTHVNWVTRSACDTQSTRNMSNINWRTINIDQLDPDSPANFDLSSLTPAVQPVSTADVQSLSAQIKQLSRGGDQEGALTGALENVPYGADDRGKVRQDRYSITRTQSRKRNVRTARDPSRA